MVHGLWKHLKTLGHLYSRASSQCKKADLIVDKGNFLNVIKSLYNQVKSCVRGNDSLTDIFRSNRGVRKGCLLSPVLFALYLNNLNRQIKESSQGVMVDDISIHSLLYADDLVLLAKNRKDLQSQLDTLNKFSKSLKMEVNLDKPKSC